MDAELIELMPHTITVEPPAGTYTDRGQVNYGTAVSYTCAIQPAGGEEIVYSAAGEERKASWTIYVHATSAIDPTSRLTLPSGYSPQQAPFYASKLWADEAGNSHVILTV